MKKKSLSSDVLVKLWWDNGILWVSNGTGVPMPLDALQALALLGLLQLEEKRIKIQRRKD